MNNINTYNELPPEVEAMIANHMADRMERAANYKFSKFLVSNDGSYSYYIADEVRRELPGMFADCVCRELNAHSGCQVAIFVRTIPKDWKKNKDWIKDQVNIYDDKGNVRPL